MTASLFFQTARRLGAMALVLAFSAALAPAVDAAPTVPEPASKPNRLIHEKSPYLRQHAYNPVDWFPWGADAFEKARREGKPIFLSIGYSTCHWCHVMERESFSDPEIARQLNESFVCIKVDREERPDVDRVYMTFVQASTGGGGWPLSVWLTPELKPFFGGTYFPAESSPGHPGFKTVVARIAEMWRTQHDSIVEQSGKMLDALAADSTAATAGALPIADLRDRAFTETARVFDELHGGFETAPKFPHPVTLEFLLDVHATSKEPARRDPALQMVLKTLREMAAGGIHDQLGGGFHRYSVDASWRVPHFEKMLYDQAQLAATYLSAWQLSSDPRLRDAAVDTLQYVRRELRDGEGGFYSAEDADSVTAADPAVRREGAFYVWTAGEIESVLGREDGALFAFAYGVEPQGNAGSDEGGELVHQNVLFRAHTPAECATKFGLTEEAARQSLAGGRERLLAARAKRSRPFRDDKIITAWNGLMISAYARAAQALGEPEYAQTAAAAAAFLEGKLYDPATGRLSRSYRAGVRDERGFVEDYAFLVQGLLDLYESTFDVHWLEWAARLQEKQNELFWDSAAGGFFANAAGDPSVVLRLKEDSDGAEPSPNSIAVRNLCRLGEMLYREGWRQQAERAAGAFAAQLKRDPTALPQLLVGLGWLEGSPKQIVVVGETASAERDQLIREVWRRYLPRHVLLRVDRGSRAYLEPKVPFVAGLPAEPEGRAMAYVCENYVCQLPTRDLATLAKLLEPVRR